MSIDFVTVGRCNASEDLDIQKLQEVIFDLMWQYGEKRNVGGGGVFLQEISRGGCGGGGGLYWKFVLENWDGCP
jgi:hypothetical protein